MKIANALVLVMALAATSAMAQTVTEKTTEDTTVTIVPITPSKDPSTPTTSTPTDPTDPTTPTAPDPNDPKENKRARLVVRVFDGGGKKDLEGATVLVERGNRKNELTTDDDGRCAVSVRREQPFTVTVSADGYDTIKFSRTLGAGADWAIARIQMFKKQTGPSLVAEWRVGRTGDNEPERDFARFVFDVNYYKDRTPIDGAKIVLIRENGKVARRLETDDDGRVETLVREQNKFDVKVKADGYHDYNTRPHPGLRATSRRVQINLRKK